MMGKLDAAQRKWLVDLGAIVGGNTSALTALTGGTKGVTDEAPPPPQPTVVPEDRRARQGSNEHRRVTKEPKLTPNNYIAMINGIDFLEQNWKQPGPLSVGQSEERDLVPKHRVLLVNLRTALILLKTNPGGAMALWNSVSPEFAAELRKSGLASEDITTSANQLAYLHKVVFVPAAYRAAKQNAKATSGLEAPDAAQMAERLSKAEQELAQAKALQAKAKEASEVFAKSHKLAGSLGKLADLDAPKEVSKIIDLVMLGGTIEQKLANAQKNGIATTAVELVAKVIGATGTIVKNVGVVGEKVILAHKVSLLARDGANVSKAVLSELDTAASGFSKLAKAGKALGTAASYAAVIADGFKLVSALRDGDLGAVVEAAAGLTVDLAPLLLGAEAGTLLGPIVLIIQAELEVLRGAAALIRWAKDETVRQAALDFVEECNKIAKGGAIDLVADWQILLDPSQASIHETTLAMAKQEAAAVSKNLQALSTHLAMSNKDAIGHYPKVVDALGDAARRALNQSYGPDADMFPVVAEQIRDVFHGANTMAAYVKKAYTN